MASPAAGDGWLPSPVSTLSAEERINLSLNPPKKSFRRPPKFTNDLPPDVQLPPPRIKPLKRQTVHNPSTQPPHISPNHSHADPPSQMQPHANQPPTSTASILSKLQEPSTTPNAVSEQKEMSINGGINDYECCREVANQSPLHSLEEGEESSARDEPALISPADGNGSQLPPAPPLTSRNEPPFLRRSQRQTSSKYRSQSPATQPQQPPTSANTANQPPSPSLQQLTPTAIVIPSTTNSKLSSPDLVNGFSSPANQPPASSPQPTQATHDHSGDAHPAVTAPMHPQNQLVPHGHLFQEPVQDATTSQPQSPPTR